MRYKAGDRVRVRKDLTVGNVYGGVLFDKKKVPLAWENCRNI